MKSLISILLLLSAIQGVAQSNRELALEYFRMGDCEKAIVYSEKLLKEQFMKDILSKHADCLIKEKKWEEMDAFIRRQTKKEDPNQAHYYFQWGRSYLARQKQAEADKQFQAVLLLLNGRPDLYTQFIEDFRRIGEPEYAKKVVLSARGALNNPSLFRLELAGIYQELRETENMILELLGYGSQVRNYDLVKNMLQDFVKEEKDGEILEKVLYEKIQASPNELFYSDLLIWRQIQKKDFYKAFLQERSLDKRLKANGARIVQLSKLALQNEDYTNSLRMYEYLMKEYPNSELYPYSRRMSIYVREEQTKRNYPVNLDEVRKLILDYEKLLEEVGTNINSLEALRNMAMLHAFYLDNRPKAIELLNKAIAAAPRDKGFADRCKLDLGDIYLLDKQPWEASLIYSQVEKSQKDDLLGYEAKLRNAKVYYYKGEFELAKSILNVLKKATSREIANDASALSLLIMDNTGLDTTEDAMRAYASIELLLFQQRYSESLDSLDALYEQLKDHSLADEILWLKASTLIKLDRNEEAEKALLEIVDKFHYDVLADDAVYKLAQLYEGKLKRNEEAMKYYQLLMEKYPASVFVSDARKRYRILRGDIVN